MKDRKFIQVDRDNFDDVLARMTPGLNLRVANTASRTMADRDPGGAQVQQAWRISSPPPSSTKCPR